MVRGVSWEGMPPPVCCCHSHQLNVSGRTAVPLVGPPHPTVAVAVTRVESWPITGANQCSLGVLPVTLTLSGALLSCGWSVVASPSLARTIAVAVASMSPQLPRAQSWATAMRSEEHTSELQSHVNLVCRLLLEKK